ncbi:gas vesicle protein GvpJ [Streptomyces sp. NPDC006333]|uniref:gas vesicle protein GvpJ n=1 Tax=Streptomyces sp. NPDC006333 TaxID=3156753 RepID=UPI0033AB8C56
MPAITYSDEVVTCPPRAVTLYDVPELILDRGMVIDVFVRVSLVGIEILKIDARIVIASVNTYLRFAEACDRLDLERDSGSVTVPELILSSSAATSIGERGPQGSPRPCRPIRRARRGRERAPGAAAVAPSSYTRWLDLTTVGGLSRG